jgi:hypothetical protein
MKRLVAISGFLVMATTWAGAAVPKQTIQISWVAFDIPSSYEYDDEEGTLVAWPRDVDGIVLRVTIHTILKDGVPVDGVGEQIISSMAAEHGLKLERTGRAVWYHTSESTRDESSSGIMHLWNIGFGAYGVVVSCYFDDDKVDHTQAKEMLAQVTGLVASLREVKRE